MVGWPEILIIIAFAVLWVIKIKEKKEGKKNQAPVTKQITGIVTVTGPGSLKVVGRKGQLELTFGPKIRPMDGKKYTVHYLEDNSVEKLLTPRKKQQP